MVAHAFFPFETLGGDMHSSLDIKKTISHCIKDGEDNSPIVTAFPRDELKNFAPGSLLMSFFSSIFQNILCINFYFSSKSMHISHSQHLKYPTTYAWQAST